MTFRIAFVLFDGLSNLVLASALEPLRAAVGLSGEPIFEWTILTPDGHPVTTSSGLRIAADGAWTDGVRGAQMVFLVAGYGVRSQGGPAVMAALQRLRGTVQVIGALDMGSWILAEGGLLDGRRATIHWQEFDSFAELFPRVMLSSDRYVFDEGLVTAGGAESVMALMLEIIRRHGGEILAHDVRSMFGRALAAALSDEPGARSVTPALARAITRMEQHMAERVPIAWIAASAGSSVRGLERRFAEELQTTPSRYYASLRLARARLLAEETDLSVSEIAVRTGFATGNTLARAFRASYGESIARMRRGSAE